jgi:hypothetical protein
VGDSPHQGGDRRGRYAATCGFLALVALALLAAVPGSAAQGQQISIDINDSFQDERLSATCGVDVFIDFVAHLRVTLV